MTRFLPDVNTLLALVDPLHVHHDAAHRWYARRSPLRLLTCPHLENGVIRVASMFTKDAWVFAFRAQDPPPPAGTGRRESPRGERGRGGGRARVVRGHAAAESGRERPGSGFWGWRGYGSSGVVWRVARLVRWTAT